MDDARSSGPAGRCTSCPRRPPPISTRWCRPSGHRRPGPVRPAGVPGDRRRAGPADRHERRMGRPGRAPGRSRRPHGRRLGADARGPRLPVRGGGALGATPGPRRDAGPGGRQGRGGPAVGDAAHRVRRRDPPRRARRDGRVAGRRARHHPGRRGERGPGAGRRRLRAGLGDRGGGHRRAARGGGGGPPSGSGRGWMPWRRRAARSGSCTAAAWISTTAPSLLAQPAVDGLFVGRRALDPLVFAAIAGAPVEGV